MSLNEQKEALKVISELLEDPYNQICADCQCQPSKWASTTLGVFICIDCSGVHRSLGTHISFVRSCTLDTWVMDQARLMKAIGNRLGNSYWESKLPKDFQRPGNSNRSLMQAFIKDKYQIKKWADSGPPPHIVYKHLLTKQLSLSNQANDQSSRKSKNSKRSHHHSSHRSSSRHPEKTQNSNVPAEIENPPQPAAPVPPAPNDLKMPLDDFFAEQPRRMIPKPYIPHKKVVYEKPKEEPDYENMNSDEIDLFFQNNGNNNSEYANVDDQKSEENGNGRNRSDSLEKAMMQRIQNILDDEKPKKAISRNKGQIEYDDNYEDDEEEDDIFGDSAVAITYPFGQHVSRSDPQISNTAQYYGPFDEDPPVNIAGLQSFFDNSSKTNNTLNTTSNLLSNNTSSINSNLSSNITQYSNLSFSPSSKPLQDNLNDEEDHHRHQVIKTKKQRSVVLSKSSKFEASQGKEKAMQSQTEIEPKKLESNEDENGNPLESLVLNEQETNEESKKLSIVSSIDNINLDIGSEYPEAGNDGNGNEDFWDDDTADNNNLDDGFFEIPPNCKLNDIKLEGKALMQAQNHPLISSEIDATSSQFDENHQKESEMQNLNESNFSTGISNDIESFDQQQTNNTDTCINQYDSIGNEENLNEPKLETPAKISNNEVVDAINDYNPFGSDKQENLGENPLASLLESQEDSHKNDNEIYQASQESQQYDPHHNDIPLNNENENEKAENKNTEISQQDDIDLDALAADIGIEEEEMKSKVNNDACNFTEKIEEEEENDDDKIQNNDDETVLIKQKEDEINDDETNKEIKSQNNDNETVLIEEEKESTHQSNEINQTPSFEVSKTSESEHQNTQKVDVPLNDGKKNESQIRVEPPAYISRPSKLSISMVSAMDLAPPGSTAEDEIIDDFFAEAEATIVPSKTSQNQIQNQSRNHHSKSRHHHRQNQNDYEYDSYNDVFDDDSNSKSRRKRESGGSRQQQSASTNIQCDNSSSCTQKSAFAPPPARKPGAHIPLRLQKKMDPPPVEKESRRKKHHHRKPE